MNTFPLVLNTSRRTRSLIPSRPSSKSVMGPVILLLMGARDRAGNRPRGSGSSKPCVALDISTLKIRTFDTGSSTSCRSCKNFVSSRRQLATEYP